MLKLLVVCEAVVEIYNKHYFNNGLDAMISNYSRITSNITCLNYGINVDVVTNNEVKGDNVKFAICKKTNSISSLWGNLKYNKTLIEKEVSENDACIVHMPSNLGRMAIKYALKYNKPYLTMVVGCAWDALWNHSFKGKLLAPYFYWSTRKAVAKADFAIYVTNNFLQNRYPTNARSLSCSDVDLLDVDEFAYHLRVAKIHSQSSISFNLVTLGTVASPYKGQRYVISAIPEMIKRGIPVKYYIVGGGNQRTLQTLVKRLGVEEYVTFCGNIKHKDIFSLLDQMDVYVQPSLTEGLPRALIEAMSRGIPAIASNVGGIPELLNKDFLFSKGNVLQIAELVTKLYKDKSFLIRSAILGFETSKKYLKDSLYDKRLEFLDEFKEYVSIHLTNNRWKR